MSGAQIVISMLLFGLFFGGLYVLRRLLVACRPGRVLILYKKGDRKASGPLTEFRLLMPGQRGFLSPFGGESAVLGTQPRKVTFQVPHVSARGGVDTLTIDLLARAQVATSPELLKKAVRLFGARPPENVQNAVIDVLEQCLRKHVARLSAGEILPQPKALAAAVLEECKPLLRGRGLLLQHLEIRKIGIA